VLNRDEAAVRERGLELDFLPPEHSRGHGDSKQGKTILSGLGGNIVGKEAGVDQRSHTALGELVTYKVRGSG